MVKLQRSQAFQNGTGPLITDFGYLDTCTQSIQPVHSLDTSVAP